MEYATGILLAESAVSNYGSLAEQLPEAGRGDAAAPRRGARIACDPGRHRSADRRHLPPRAGAGASRAGRPRDRGRTCAGWSRVLDAFFRDTTKRSEIATLSHGQSPDSRRFQDAGAGRSRSPAAALRRADRQLREPGHSGRRRRTRASRRIAVRARVLRRGAAAAARRRTAADRAALGEAPRRGRGGRPCGGRR